MKRARKAVDKSNASTRRVEAGDERSYAQIAEERCSELESFVVRQIGHPQASIRGGVCAERRAWEPFYSYRSCGVAYSRPGRQPSTW